MFVWDLASNADAERVFGGRKPLHQAIVGDGDTARLFALVEEKAYLLQVVVEGDTPRLQVAHLGGLEGGSYVEELGDDDVVVRFSHADLPAPLEERFGAGQASKFEDLRAVLRSWAVSPLIVRDKGT